ncbi:MAG: polysaccharide pyruvyl transferase family protein, partial [Lachnospira sp.]|nr:polysaccharide pyruvyl transferase family protein [Lachnospira sp.]
YFRKEENKLHTAVILNTAHKMLFLARDYVSFEMAKQMMPDIKVMAYPDIVTTLIGTLNFNNERNGICLCTRNDGEKLYTKEEIDELEEKFLVDGVRVQQKDTQSNATITQIRSNLKKYIESEIESYSHFKVTITDRYHGTIFSLCAGTPVIIIKTTDHKVTTGADWFKGVYDEYVYVANDLVDAYQKAKDMMLNDWDNKLLPYFKTEYYDKLKDVFEIVCEK